MHRIGFGDIVEPPIVAAIWGLFSWLWARGVNRAAGLDRLTAFQKVGIVYGAWFFLGMAYVLNLAGAFGIPNGGSAILVVAWAAILTVVARCRYQK